METEIDRAFRSDDISLVSYLITQDIELIDTIQDRPNHFTFLLSNSENCIQLKQQYLNNAPAPARQLFSVREMLISEIKNRNRNGDSGNEKV